MQQTANEKKNIGREQQLPGQAVKLTSGWKKKKRNIGSQVTEYSLKICSTR